MNYLGIALFVAFACVVSADDATDKAKVANQPVYDAVNRPYNYRPYGGDAYNYNPNRRYAADPYGAYPSTYDAGAHRLHLQGGTYRPYGYEDSYAYDTGYNRPYAYDNAYRQYNPSASRYMKNPYAYNRRY